MQTVFLFLLWAAATYFPGESVPMLPRPGVEYTIPRGEVPRDISDDPRGKPRP